jgi:hypothetical protein
MTFIKHWLWLTGVFCATFLISIYACEVARPSPIGTAAFFVAIPGIIVDMWFFEIPKHGAAAPTNHWLIAPIAAATFWTLIVVLFWKLFIRLGRNDARNRVLNPTL